MKNAILDTNRFWRAVSVGNVEGMTEMDVEGMTEMDEKEMKQNAEAGGCLKPSLILYVQASF